MPPRPSDPTRYACSGASIAWAKVGFNSSRWGKMGYSANFEIDKPLEIWKAFVRKVP
jgi:hypothetical protein